MNNTEIQEALLEIIEQLKIQKRTLQDNNSPEAIDSDPQQVDVFSENKMDALNYCQNLLIEKFGEYLPESTTEIQSQEYDVFKNGITDALSELDQLTDDVKHKKSGDASHPSTFDKGVIEGIKRSSRIFRRKLHELI
jgi:hypothetical protein